MPLFILLIASVKFLPDFDTQTDNLKATLHEILEVGSGDDNGYMALDYHYRRSILIFGIVPSNKLSGCVLSSYNMKATNHGCHLYLIFIMACAFLR
jgi:hypothetical protein